MLLGRPSLCLVQHSIRNLLFRTMQRGKPPTSLVNEQPRLMNQLHPYPLLKWLNCQQGNRTYHLDPQLPQNHRKGMISKYLTQSIEKLLRLLEPTKTLQKMRVIFRKQRIPLEPLPTPVHSRLVRLFHTKVGLIPLGLVRTHRRAAAAAPMLVSAVPEQGDVELARAG